MLNNIEQSNIDRLIPEVSVEIKLQNIIGKGGQKLVYKAVNIQTGTPVVFKVLKPNFDTLNRVKREVLAVELIGHANIPRVIETNVDRVSDSNDLIWILEEHIEGEDLRSCLKKGKTFTLSEVVDFLDVMLSILEKAEAQKIVHRDIKPENIIYGYDGVYWLIDFGISRHLDLESITLTHEPFGLFTIGYSAAEQFRNRKKDIDIRSDLFSLGVVVSEMIQGYNYYLHEAHDILQVIRKIERQPLPAVRIVGDELFFLARFIKMLGDNRLSRRPNSVSDAKDIFEIVKSTLTI